MISSHEKKFLTLSFFPHEESYSNSSSRRVRSADVYEYQSGLSDRTRAILKLRKHNFHLSHELEDTVEVLFVITVDFLLTNK